MYYHHFGLKGPPFQFTPNAHSLYLSREHREALAFLEWSVLHEPTGFAALVGESGVGKTTLICSLIALYSDSVDLALVTNPRLSIEQLIITVLSQLGVAAGGFGKFEAIERFMRLLDDRASNSGVAIIVDEAQELTDEVFSDLRLLSNQGMARGHSLRIVLVGQPELLERLKSPQLNAINQRIGARAVLTPMRAAEAYEYVKCQVEAKGAQVSKVFVPAALRVLVEQSHGNPRRINVLCHNALLTAYGSRRNRVDMASARSAIAEYDNLSVPRQRSHPNIKKLGPSRWTRPLLLLTVTAAVLLTVAFALIRHHYWLSELFGGNSQTATSEQFRDHRVNDLPMPGTDMRTGLARTNLANCEYLTIFFPSIIVMSAITSVRESVRGRRVLRSAGHSAESRIEVTYRNTKSVRESSPFLKVAPLRRRDAQI